MDTPEKATEPPDHFSLNERFLTRNPSVRQTLAGVGCKRAAPPSPGQIGAKFVLNDGIRQLPPLQEASIALRDEPGCMAFHIDGSIAWPSTGDVINVESRQIMATLTDEECRAIQSEKIFEIVFRRSDPVAAGCQFGIGAVRTVKGNEK